jgi:hypothetical protein
MMHGDPLSGWWDWTVLICYTIGPWAALWLLGDHRHFRRAVGAGLLYALIASVLDDYGVSLDYWRYPEQPIPLLTGNAVWNIVAAAPEAIFISEVALGRPRQLWPWTIGLAMANAAAEFFALLTTNLLDYPHWSPLLSLPVYLAMFWVTIWYTRWVWVPGEWKPPGKRQG